MVSTEKISEIGSLLRDSKRPLKERFRALFTLKNIGGDQAVKEICGAFADDSSLLKHELAYCLGQMQNTSAIPKLIEVLSDVSQEPMVRHECGEALGAIGVPEVQTVLEKFSKDPVVEVAETCTIALERVKFVSENKFDNDGNPYASVDPSPASESVDISELKSTYMDPSESLFKRYRAMFSLRNMRNEDGVLALCEGLKDKSALFRHEVAFVLGQLQEPCSIPFLKENLTDTQENAMVRHECAEALGAIATEECIQILNNYLEDEARVVKESCIIALDMCEYENSPEFQYADSLAKLGEKTL